MSTFSSTKRGLPLGWYDWTRAPRRAAPRVERLLAAWLADGLTALLFARSQRRRGFAGLKVLGARLS